MTKALRDALMHQVKMDATMTETMSASLVSDLLKLHRKACRLEALSQFYEDHKGYELTDPDEDE